MQVSTYHRKIAEYRTRQLKRLENANFLEETPGIRKQKDVRIPPESLIWGILHPDTVQVGQKRNILPFSLAKNRYTMGRAADNDIVLEDPDVGRYHLVFEHDPVKHCATITTHSSRGVLITHPRLGLRNSYRLQRGVPYPLCDQDYFSLGGRAVHTWTFTSYVGQLVPYPSTEYRAEYEAVLLRVLPAVQEHVRDMACRPRKAKPESVDPKEVNIDSVHLDARLLTEGDARKMLAFHLILGHLNPPDQPKYPVIPMPPENNDGKTLTQTERVRSPTPPPNPLLSQVPPPPRNTRRLREEWPAGAMFGRKDRIGRLPPMRGYSPDPTSWDIKQYDEYGIEGHPSTRQPAPKAGPSRAPKRSRDSIDSGVSGPSDEERPSQRRRSPAPPPETPAQARRRLLPTRTRQPAARPSRQPTAGPSSRAATGASRHPTAGPSRSQASASNSRKRSRDDDDDEDDDAQSFSSAEVKANISSSPSPSPAPAPKKRRTQKQSNAKSDPDVKPRPKTRAQVQVQPTRRSQRLAARPDDESRAPPRAAPLASVAGANTAAKGKARAGESGAGRRRR